MIEVRNEPIGTAFDSRLPYDITDPVLKSVAAAPEDDEPLTAEDEKALVVADQEIASGQTVPDAE